MVVVMALVVVPVAVVAVCEGELATKVMVVAAPELVAMAYWWWWWCNDGGWS